MVTLRWRRTRPSATPGRGRDVHRGARPQPRAGRSAHPFARVPRQSARRANFNEGTAAGLGRVSLGGKAQFVHEDWVDAAVSMEVFLPSRARTSAQIQQRRVPAAPGSRRSTWWTASRCTSTRATTSTPSSPSCKPLRGTPASRSVIPHVTDTGLGGLEVQPIWHRVDAVEVPCSRRAQRSTPLQFQARQRHHARYQLRRLPFGVKGQVRQHGGERCGMVNVPLNDQGIRADAVGTVAVERCNF